MIETVRRHIVVVGGGIAGLAAAHRLIELSPQFQVTLHEGSSRLGGVISTVHEGGFEIEQSADNFITTTPWAIELCRRLNLGEQIIETNAACRRTFVVRNGRLHRLPDGFMMMAPTQIWPLVTTPLLSPLGKLRAALEYFLPPRLDDDDESMGHFVRRRLGKEAWDRLVEPLISAVYAADMEKLSVAATLSRFRDMERQHGSLIRAMRLQMKRRPVGASESGARYSMFVTLAGGLCTLVNALAARLPVGAVHLQSPVTRVERRGDAWRVHFEQNETSSGAAAATAKEFAAAPSQVSEMDKRDRESPPAIHCSFIDCDGLILATPAHVSARLLRDVDSQLAAELGAIEHSGTAIISLGYDRADIGHPLDGMGVVVPSIENSPLLACSFSSQKYPHRAPEGKTLLRVFVGGAYRPELAEMADAELMPLVLKHLEPLLQIRGKPCYSCVMHWPRTMPQYHVGHTLRVDRIMARLEGLPGLQLAGNTFRGVGLPDCIHSGELAAEHAASAAI